MHFLTLPGPNPSVSESKGQTGLRTGISNKFLADAEAAIVRTTALKNKVFLEKNRKWMMGGQER